MLNSSGDIISIIDKIKHSLNAANSCTKSVVTVMYVQLIKAFVLVLLDGEAPYFIPTKHS
jgi:hypothetical protein